MLFSRVIAIQHFQGCQIIYTAIGAVVSPGGPKWKLLFKVSKCKIMHLGKKDPLREDIRGTVLASTTEEKYLGVLISDDCKMSKQCDQAVRS